MKKIIICLFITLLAGLLSAQTNVEPLINNDWTTFTWPYNAYYPEDPNGVNGHVGNACGYTSIAKILHYWEFPVNGSGILDYYDTFGYHWYCDLTNLNLNYSAMPYTLPENATPEEYHETANLFLACGAVGETIPIWAPSEIENVPPIFIDYFNFSQTVELVKRWEYTREEWINIYKNELNNGRPIMMDGRTADSPAPGQPGQVSGHWWICDGYNESDEFYINYAYGGIAGYYDIDSLGVYFAWNRAIIGLQPELNGKEILVTSPNGGETLSAEEETDITWNSENISDIRIEYTLDSGLNWQEIIANIPAATGIYSWMVPNVVTNLGLIKISDVSDINIYDRSDEVFLIAGGSLTLISPNGGEYILQGSTTSIAWENTLVPDITIEYSIDNGSNWIEIIASTSTASGNYEWTVPNVISDQCKIKITDINDVTNYDESDEVFEIIVQNILGGPYLVDENTILLLSFDGNLTNQSSLTDDGISYGPLIYYETHNIPELSQCIRMENSYIPNVPPNESYITVPHNDNLNLTGDWTIEAWIKMTAETPNLSIVLCKPGDVDYWHSNYTLSRNMSWQMVGDYFAPASNSGAGVATEEGVIPLYNWFHFAFIRDTSDRSLKMLIRNQNRELIAEATSNYSPDQDIPATSDQDLFIGKMINEHFFFLDGYIDEVRISNIARSFSLEPDAEFSADATNGIIPLTVNFTDLSTYVIEPLTIWEWDFDNNGTIDSYEQNPSHTYLEAGIYSVSLTVSDGTYSDTEIKTDYITVIAAIIADFEAEPLFGAVPLEVQFTDLSISNNLQNRNEYTESKQQLSSKKNKRSNRKKSESERFHSNRNRDIVAWEWDFDNDGVIDSYEQNPLYTYPETGIYTVSLTVTDENDYSDSETKVDYISVTGGQTSFALQFDGSDDYVEVSNMSFPVNDLTIEAWIYTENSIEDQYIVAGYSGDFGAQFRVNLDGSLLYGEYSPWNFIQSDANSILPDVWTHVAVTKQGNDCNLYINGLNSTYSQFNINPVTSILHIGCRGVDMDGFFNGNIDEVRMWTIARTESEIQESMNNYLTGSENGLIAYWRMNEGNGQIVFDMSGNGNNGQLGSTSGNDVNDPVWIATDWPYCILQADFSASPVSGNAPLEVDFTDLTTGNPISWEWDFDNDSTIDSNEQNPSYTYSESGLYTVSLTVSNGTDFDTETKNDYIDVIGTGVGTETIPLVTKLVGSFPNPFNPSTTIRYDLNKAANVRIQVFNIKGQIVTTLLDRYIEAGKHSIVWNGKDTASNSVSSGLYLYKLIIDDKTLSMKKCLLLK